ncbi:hypothetical protein [Acidisphaera sp. S103]|uniref:hypothetical protein n=1 Tax=Acidisphaera sp. S103 TaxID=1747223 RepID=UPI00352F6BEF
MVTFFHLTYWSWAPVESLTKSVSGGVAEFPSMAKITWLGWVGVEIFFVISGFVISYSAAGVSPFVFLRRRIIRSEWTSSGKGQGSRLWRPDCCFSACLSYAIRRIRRTRLCGSSLIHWWRLRRQPGCWSGWAGSCQVFPVSTAAPVVRQV